MYVKLHPCMSIEEKELVVFLKPVKGKQRRMNYEKDYVSYSRLVSTQKDELVKIKIESQRTSVLIENDENVCCLLGLTFNDLAHLLGMLTAYASPAVPRPVISDSPLLMCMFGGFRVYAKC